MIALVCLHCNHSNLDDAKYCSKCGAGLLRRLCPSCHVANGGDSQFCQDCGFRLPAEAQAPTLVSVAAPQQATRAMRAAPEAEPEDASAHVLVDEPRTVPMWPTSAWRPGAGGSPLAVLGASELVHEVTDVSDAMTSRRRFNPGPRALALAAAVVACLVVWVLKGPATPTVDVVSAPAEPVAAAVAKPVASERRAEPAVLAMGTAAVVPAAVAAIAPPVRVEPPAPSSTQPVEAPMVTAAASAAAASPGASEPVAAPAVVIAPKPVAEPRAVPVVVARVEPARRTLRNGSRQREALAVEARPEVAAPAPTAAKPRESPTIACTDKVQALGLCTLKP